MATEQTLLNLTQAGLSPAEHWPRYRSSLPTKIRDVADVEMAVISDLARYKFRGAASELSWRQEPEIVLSGPAGTGKSLGVLHHIFDLAVHNPGLRALLVRKTAVSLAASGLVTWRTKIVPKSLEARAVEYYGGSAQEPAQYRLWNGSKIMIGGMDNSAKVMSTEFDVVFCQEAIELSEEDWEALTTRLRNGVLSNMQMLGDTNPSTPTHWLKERCDKGTTLMLESRHEDNPALFDDSDEVLPAGKDYISKLDRLTGVRLHRLRFGRWVAAEGVVYEQWDPHVNMIDKFPIPRAWPRYWVVDFGYTNPFVCQWWAIDPDGRAYMYREYVKTQTIVEDHAKRMLRLVQDRHGNWQEPKPRAIICDHDAEGRATLQRHLGLTTRRADKTVTTGIERTMERIRVAGDGKPRLFVFRNCLIERDSDMDDYKLPQGVSEEILSYIWAKTPDGKPNKEEPEKRDDHSMDAMRYLVMTLDKGKPTIRGFG